MLNISSTNISFINTPQHLVLSTPSSAPRPQHPVPSTSSPAPRPQHPVPSTSSPASRPQHLVLSTSSSASSTSTTFSSSTSRLPTLRTSVGSGFFGWFSCQGTFPPHFPDRCRRSRQDHSVFEEISTSRSQFEWTPEREYQLPKLKTLFILYSVIIFRLNTLND